MLSYKDIYQSAREDLSVYGILELAARQDIGLADEIFHQKVETIFLVVLAYYNAWFFHLSSKLAKDNKIKPEQIQLYFKGFQSASSFPEEITANILAEIKYNCIEHGNSFLHPEELSKKIHLNNNIQDYIKKTLEGAKNFSDIDNIIRNSEFASSRIFPGIDTYAFQDAYKTYKSGFLNYVRLESLLNVLKPNDKNLAEAKRLLEAVTEPVFLFYPAQDNSGALFHKICQEGSAELVTIVLEKMNEYEEESVIAVVQEGAPKNWLPKYLNEKLFACAKAGNNNEVFFCLKLGADINANTTGSKKTAIGLAAEAGHTGTVKLLLNEGASLEKADAMWSPLHLACKTNPENAELVGIILNAGADANEEDINKNTPLLLAVKAGYEEVVIKLLKHGADPYFRDANGNTALHLAASQCNKKICQTLIYHGASLEIKNNQNKTPSEVAASKSYSALVQDMKTWRKESQELGFSEDKEQMKKRLKFQKDVINEQTKLIEKLRKENEALKRELSLQRRQSSIISFDKTQSANFFEITGLTSTLSSSKGLAIIAKENSNKSLATARQRMFNSTITSHRELGSNNLQEDTKAASSTTTSTSSTTIQGVTSDVQFGK